MLLQGGWPELFRLAIGDEADDVGNDLCGKW